MNKLTKAIIDRQKQLKMLNVDVAKYLGVTPEYYWRILNTAKKEYKGQSARLNIELAKFLKIKPEKVIELAKKEVD